LRSNTCDSSTHHRLGTLASIRHFVRSRLLSPSVFVDRDWRTRPPWQRCGASALAAPGHDRCAHGRAVRAHRWPRCRRVLSWSAGVILREARRRGRRARRRFKSMRRHVPRECRRVPGGWPPHSRDTWARPSGRVAPSRAGVAFVSHPDEDSPQDGMRMTQSPCAPAGGTSHPPVVARVPDSGRTNRCHPQSPHMVTNDDRSDNRGSNRSWCPHATPIATPIGGYFTAGELF
jgi:hypothetical protein